VSPHHCAGSPDERSDTRGGVRVARMSLRSSGLRNEHDFAISRRDAPGVLHQPRPVLGWRSTKSRCCRSCRSAAPRFNRMEKAGKFPRSTYISPSRRVWFADEIIAWQNAVDECDPRRGRAKGVVAVRLVRRRGESGRALVSPECCPLSRSGLPLETAAKPNPTRVSLAWQSSPLQ
jgi:predicted DNA-binding transcriptional regulator AlpA